MGNGQTATSIGISEGAESGGIGCGCGTDRIARSGVYYSLLLFFRGQGKGEIACYSTDTFDR